jgi:hypothetical protein
MKSDSAEELRKLIADSIQNYPREKLDSAFKNVSKRGNRPVDMERLKKLYLSLVQV